MFIQVKIKLGNDSVRSRLINIRFIHWINEKGDICLGNGEWLETTHTQAEMQNKLYKIASV